MNAVDHYMGKHTKCHPTSQCKYAPHYEPSRIVITQKKAEDLLRDAIRKSLLYRFADYFVLSRDTAHVESFNNTMNMFHDKRVFYSDLEYGMRSHIAVLYWNENVGREHTSIWEPEAANRAGTRGARRRKNYKDATFKHRSNVWARYMNQVFN
jgi:hypothetical protein